MTLKQRASLWESLAMISFLPNVRVSLMLFTTGGHEGFTLRLWKPEKKKSFLPSIIFSHRVISWSLLEAELRAQPRGHNSYDANSFVDDQQEAFRVTAKPTFSSFFFFFLHPMTVTWPRRHHGVFPRCPRLEWTSMLGRRSADLLWRRRCDFFQTVFESYWFTHHNTNFLVFGSN